MNPPATSTGRVIDTGEGGSEPSVLSLVLEQARRFALREIDPIVFDREARLPHRVLEAAARAGLFGLSVAEKHGGLGLPLGQVCKVVSALAERDGGFATTVGLHNGLGIRGLAAYGEPALQEKWLPRLASGECVASFAATETAAGSDLMSIRTTASPVEGGVRLDGEKNYVTNGGFAGLFTVLARSPELGGARSHCLICVPRDTPGLQIGAEEHKVGLRSSSTVTVHFDGAVVPMQNVLGTPGQGMRYAQHALTWGRTVLASGCVGATRNAMTASLAHVTTRKQFGRAIGEFGASRAHMAAMASRLWAMEAMVENTGRVEAQGQPIEVLSAATKVFCSDGAFDVCDRAIQLHGALGVLSDVGVDKLLRDCRVTRIFEGANDVVLVHIGAWLLSLRQPDRFRCVHRETAAGEPSLADACRKWHEIDGRLEKALDEVRHQYGVKAVKKQHLLQRLARTHVALQAASVSIQRAEGSAEAAMAVAQNATHLLLAEAEQNLEAVPAAEDDAVRDNDITEALYTAGRMPEPVA
jgi:acyl-CoA dehydrogenase